MPLVGRSQAMQAVFRMISRVLRNDLTVLILGESGTGKELVAEAIHELGDRRTGPFIAVNTAAIPAELIESELFGHEKGAFTGRGRAPYRQVRTSGGRNPVSRRDRRHADAGADPAAARAAIGHDPPRRRAR
jgi:two-component system nitrogen regulation response regulator GlnG